MKFITAVAALITVACQVTGKTIAIAVGHLGNPYFKPDYTKADVGDVIEFRFDSKEHSVVQGDFFTGCYPIADGGFYSGMHTSPNVFRVTVKNTDPIMVYSSSGLECQLGMVAVINADGLQTLTAYRAKAKTSIKNTSPDTPFGGELNRSDTKIAKSSASAASYAVPIAGLTLFAAAALA